MDFSYEFVIQQEDTELSATYNLDSHRET